MLARFQLRLFNLPRWQRTLWITFIAQVCSAIGFSMIFPFLPLYVEFLGSTTGLSIEFLAGLVFSSQGITMMLISPVWGALADRYGRKLMVQRAMFGGAAIIFLMALVRSAEELVLLRTIQGLITGTVSAANALVAASVPRERTGYAMGLIQVGLWSGVAVGPLVGGVMADHLGFRTPFIITAGLLVVSGLMVFFGVHEEFTDETRANNKSQGFFSEWRHILSMDGVLQTYSIRFLSGLSRSMIIPILPLFVGTLMVGNLLRIPLPEILGGLSAVTAGVSTYTGLVIGITSASATVSGIYLGRLGDRIGHRRVVVGSAIAATLVYIPQPFVIEVWQLLVLQALAGLAIGGLVAAPSALLARYTDPGEEGAVYGLDNSVLAGGRAIAPLLGAGIASWLGLRATFASVIFVFLIVVAVAMALLPEKDPVQVAQEQREEEKRQEHEMQPSV